MNSTKMATTLRESAEYRAAIDEMVQIYMDLGSLLDQNVISNPKFEDAFEALDKGLKEVSEAKRLDRKEYRARIEGEAEFALSNVLAAYTDNPADCAAAIVRALKSSGLDHLRLEY